MTYHPVLSTPGHSSTLLPILIVDIGATASRTCVRGSRITAPGCPAVSTIRIGANHIVLVVSHPNHSVSTGMLVGMEGINSICFVSARTSELVFLTGGSVVPVAVWISALCAWHVLGGRVLGYKVNPKNIRVNNPGVTEGSMRSLQLLI